MVTVTIDRSKWGRGSWGRAGPYGTNHHSLGFEQVCVLAHIADSLRVQRRLVYLFVDDTRCYWEVNDDPKLGEWQREARLTEIAARDGINLEFVGSEACANDCHQTDCQQLRDSNLMASACT